MERNLSSVSGEDKVGNHLSRLICSLVNSLHFVDWLPSSVIGATEVSRKSSYSYLVIYGEISLQEWNLLLEKCCSNFRGAVNSLTEVLGSGSQTLAAQDFRHTLQKDQNTV